MATPFYTYKPPTQSALPPPPTGVYNLENRPGLAAENNTLREIDALPAVYAPLRTAAKASLQDSLKGFGNLFTFGHDDPSTPVDESLNVDYNEHAQPGEVYRSAFAGVKNRRAALGTLYSSYTDRDLVAESERLSAIAKQMVTQYAKNMGDLASREASDRNTLVSNLTNLYGADAQWLADQTPPRLGEAGSRPDGLFNWKEWVAYQRKRNRPAPEINPDNFWKYIAAHGGQRS